MDIESQEEQNELDDLTLVGSGLMRLAEEQIAIRQEVEDRWLKDLEQYLGEYDNETKAKLNDAHGSKAFVNGTRAKTAALEARLSDMLFPTDDRNWGIGPTPVPDLQDIKRMPVMMDDYGQPMVDEQGNSVSGLDYAEMIMRDARDKAELMESEIDDQLKEAHYQDVCRDVIHDACLFGTGVIKAPVIINRTRKSWEKVDGDVYSLSMVNEYKPGVEHVKIWDWFPDMSATDIDSARFFFERRYVSKKQLLDLAKRPGYNAEQIYRAIKEEPRQTNASGSSYIAKLRELSNLSVDINKGRYELWEYHGPLEVDDLRICGCDVGDDETEEHEVVIVFIGTNIIKADLNPMETGERPYSVFVCEKDDSSIFGQGVPYMVRNEQRIMNAAWRMIIDNAGLSTGSQVIVNREVVVPADGNWELKPRKTWWVNDPTIDVRRAFGTFDIPSHQAELTAIYELAKQMMDDVTNLPLLAQGEVGGAPDTATGMSMLMNSSNVVLRRIVKGFDDNITVPVITRFYDWNMQFNDREEIKGDYNVDARGSSTLLVKETQTQALLGLMQIANSPSFAPLTKVAELYRKAVQAQHLVADDIVKTDDEIEQEKSQPQQPPIEILMAQLEQETKLQIEKMRNETDVLIAQIRSQDNMTKAQIDAQRTQLQEDNKANMFMVEKRFAETTGNGRGL